MPVAPAELATLPLFRRLGAPELAALAALARVQRCDPGQVLALEGDADPQVIVVLNGLVRVRQISLEGREHVLAYLGPGGCANLASALDGLPALATVDALTEAQVATFPARRLGALLAEQPGLAQAVALALAADVRRLSGTVKELALHTVRMRLARFLLSSAEATPAQQRWTQEMIASQLGTVRDVVGRLLRAFADEGLIRRELGQLVIVDRLGLERQTHE